MSDEAKIVREALNNYAELLTRLMELPTGSLHTHKECGNIPRSGDLFRCGLCKLLGEIGRTKASGPALRALAAIESEVIATKKELEESIEFRSDEQKEHQDVLDARDVTRGALVKAEAYCARQKEDLAFAREQLLNKCGCIERLEGELSEEKSQHSRSIIERNSAESVLAAARKALEEADRVILSLYSGPSDLRFNNDADLADFHQARIAAIERINGEGHEPAV